MVKLILSTGDELQDIDLVIFDKDGTITDIWTYWSKMVLIRSELICEHLNLDKSYVDKLTYIMGIDTKKRRIRPNGPVGVKKREIVLDTVAKYLNHIDYNDAISVCSNVFDEVDEISIDLLKDISIPIPGSIDLMRGLHKRGCCVAIATTDITERAALAAKHLGIDGFIDTIIGADLIKKPKPDPEIIKLICSITKIKKANAVIVGDTINDVMTGLNAGIKSIGVCSGIAKKNHLIRVTPYVVNSVNDIKIGSG